MSMSMLTCLQFIYVFGLYAIMTLLVPALIWHKKVKNESMGTRIFIYQTAGNFLLINLVFFLQLLHISNRITLTVGTIGIVAFGSIRCNEIPVLELMKHAADVVARLFKGTYGIKLLLATVFGGLWKQIRKVVRKLAGSIRHHFLEWILLIGLFAGIFWIYSTVILDVFGYTASDVPVHNYWINEMGKDNLFVKGIYPFGFHCVIYYLHTVFGVETFVLLRVFGMVQTLWIHMILFLFIRMCCKSAYVSYMATGIFGLVDIFGRNTYSRYYCTLPQEFGMIFILPSIYFLYRFFDQRKKEEGKGWRVPSSSYLVWFAMSFGLTLAVHFYDTMIAGLFCVGVAIGYFFRLFRRKYFGRVMLAGIISVVLAVLPMGIAFAGGTPLQGSLGWGMSVISGKEEGDSVEEEEKIEYIDGVTADAVTADAVTADAVLSEATPAGVVTSEAIATGSVPIQGKIVKVAKRIGNYLWQSVSHNVVSNAENEILQAVFLTILISGALGLVLLLTKAREYGAKMLSVFTCITLIFAVLISGELGLPRLMDPNRCSIYLAYLLPITIAFAVDGIIFILCGWMKRDRILNIVSLLVLGLVGACMVQMNHIKEPSELTGLESNAAVTTLTNIREERDDFTFTICSANDELRMVEDYGYHVETVTFLRSMENSGWKRIYTIPSEYIYFFIEKRPLDYTVAYEGSGQLVSKEGAAKPMPWGSGISIYQGENRWVMMSKMYYWAEAFKELYPNEMKVYYESDDFICYELKQNTYSLYDLSIDYGFNTTVVTGDE